MQKSQFANQQQDDEEESDSDESESAQSVHSQRNPSLEDEGSMVNSSAEAAKVDQMLARLDLNVE